MIAYIAATITIGILLFVFWEVGQPSADDYADYRGLDKLED